MTVSIETAIENAAQAVATTREFNADKIALSRAAVESLNDDGHPVTNQTVRKALDRAEEIWNGYRMEAGVFKQ